MSTCNATTRALGPRARRAAIAAASAIAAVASGDFVGLSGEWSMDPASGCCALELHACFDDPDSVLLGVANARIQLVGAPIWTQDDLTGSCILGGGSWLPAPANDPPSPCDSFVTIGGEPGAGNTTVFDPNFLAAPCTDEIEFGGWFNSNPPNLQGQVDAQGKVLVARFAIVHDPDAPPPAVIVDELLMTWNLGLGTQTELAFAVDAVFVADCEIEPECLDLTEDGVVDGADLGVLLSEWGPCPGCDSDLNGDDVVDGADLGLLLGAWGSCG